MSYSELYSFRKS